MTEDVSILSDSSDLSSCLSLSPPLSPISELENTPTPPPELRKHPRNYPLSPPASQEASDCDSPTPDGMESRDGQPPAKRRRVSKDAATGFLDLSSDTVSEEQQAQFERLMRVLHKRRKIVVIAGAGISASAGIPVFRSTSGIFSSLKVEHKLKGSGKDLFDASVYNDPETTTAFHSMIRDMSQLTKVATPTAFHHMLASLAQQGRLLRLYTQNVDGIDTSLPPLNTVVPLRKQADGKWPKTIQLHGGLEKMVCSKCHELSDLDPFVFEGPTAPPCPACIEMDDTRQVAGKRSHGIGRLRPRMVLYSERNPDEEAIGTVAQQDLRRRPDAVIVVGTTLKVPGVCRIVREMCGVVKDHRDGVTIWINNDPPPAGPQFEDCFDLVVSGPADAVASHADLPRWDEPLLTETSSNTGSSQRTSPIPATLHPMKPPSDNHFNNSFVPPIAAQISFQSEPEAPMFSPHKPRAVYVHRSIEDEGGASLPMLTKSTRGSPAKKSLAKNPLLAFQAANKDSKIKKPRKPVAKKSKKTEQSSTINFNTKKGISIPASKKLDDLDASIRVICPNKNKHASHMSLDHGNARTSPSKTPANFPNLTLVENRDPAVR